MRRKDREITDKKVILDIISRAQVCYLGMSKDSMPYVIPINFGYFENTIYFHCAPEGEKIDILKKNPNVCMVFNVDNELTNNIPQDDWTMYYKSVIAYGKVEFIMDIAEKQRAINVMFHHYGGNDYPLPEPVLEKTMFMKVEIKGMTGKGNIPEDG
ncbi:MAG: pyridoxamine 5'-phosphate oxidase family protein [Candidatus Cloacimonetes bacterium]|jgi:nitroimidazol reductase NimA-like FMN-containing flavoprotein (pyridoxamine 5'-phosphate oxidase superfamily)|nr:pyridoxamine 5'-phosphate oxidase family protein [Candidatus Cloacimonadota bacterium]